jgi:hypothetical protein
MKIFLQITYCPIHRSDFGKAVLEVLVLDIFIMGKVLFYSLMRAMGRSEPYYCEKGLTTSFILLDKIYRRIDDESFHPDSI